MFYNPAEDHHFLADNGLTATRLPSEIWQRGDFPFVRLQRTPGLSIEAFDNGAIRIYTGAVPPEPYHADCDCDCVFAGYLPNREALQHVLNWTGWEAQAARHA
jgi:hypothetical protein